MANGKGEVSPVVAAIVIILVIIVVVAVYMYIGNRKQAPMPLPTTEGSPDPNMPAGTTNQPTNSGTTNTTGGMDAHRGTGR